MVVYTFRCVDGNDILFGLFIGFELPAAANPSTAHTELDFGRAVFTTCRLDTVTAGKAGGRQIGKS